jgi:hypothetical protein
MWRHVVWSKCTEVSEESSTFLSYTEDSATSLRRIWASYRGDYDELYLLEYNAV